MGTPYESDIIAWAEEQAALLRSGNISEIDVSRIADELQELGKGELRKLAAHMSLLLGYMLKWQFKPEWRHIGARAAIKFQRKKVKRLLAESPSLNRAIDDQDWLASVWANARAFGMAETPQYIHEECTWSLDQLFDDDFWPA